MSLPFDRNERCFVRYSMYLRMFFGLSGSYRKCLICYVSISKLLYYHSQCFFRKVLSS